MVEDRIQNLDSVTCGIFQIYFYDNLFNPDQNSKIQNKTKLIKKTIETLLNQLLVLDDQEQTKVVGNRATLGHFLKSQDKFFLSFLCTLFVIFLTPKKL